MEMTENDKKKEFLRRYRECERREQQSDLSDYVVAMERQIGRLKRERLKKARTREQIDLAIRRMENPDEQRVLRLRYLWGLNWDDIGRKMGYDPRHARRIHGWALKNFKMS